MTIVSVVTVLRALCILTIVSIVAVESIVGGFVTMVSNDNDRLLTVVVVAGVLVVAVALDRANQPDEPPRTDCLYHINNAHRDSHAGCPICAGLADRVGD